MPKPARTRTAGRKGKTTPDETPPVRRKTRIVRQLRNGQITIPKEFRDALRLEGDGLLELTLGEGAMTLAPVATPARGSKWVKQLYDLFAPVRNSLEGYTEQEINDAIDDAIRGAREEIASNQAPG